MVNSIEPKNIFWGKKAILYPLIFLCKKANKKAWHKLN